MEENQKHLNKSEQVSEDKVENSEKKAKNKEKKPNKNQAKHTGGTFINKINLLFIISICLAVIGISIATIALVLSLNTKKEDSLGLKFYPDGNGNYIVAVGDAKYLSEIVIPDTYNGKNVIAIEDYGFAECNNLKKIVIPDSIKTIGNYAFENCSSLTTVNMSSSVTSMGMYAFSGCTSLADIKLSESLQNIGDHAFYNCTSLVSISIPDSVVDIGINVFMNCDNLGYNKYDNAYYLGSPTNPYHTLARAINTDITSCTVHPDTKVIYYQAFNYCTNLEEIELPSRVVSIGAEAFIYCRNLKEVVLHDSIYSIYDRVFSSCESLTDIYYTGSEEQMYSIYISADNEEFYNAYLFYNYNSGSN